METERWTAGRVVSLLKYRKRMVYNPIAEVEAYWEALRGLRLVPLRSEIDPRGIERALDHTFLLEKIAPGLSRFRLAGKVLNELMGMEVRGMPVTACFTPDARDHMRDALSVLFEGPEAVTVKITAASGFGRPGLSGEMVMLPLKSDLGDISRALGCLRIEGRIGRAPRRFDVSGTSYRGIGPFQTEQPVAPSAVPAIQAPNDDGLADPPRPFDHAPSKPRDRTHLKLVKNEKEN